MRSRPAALPTCMTDARSHAPCAAPPARRPPRRCGRTTRRAPSTRSRSCSSLRAWCPAWAR
eukprot:796734-Prymnesium_polylepis.1